MNAIRSGLRSAFNPAWLERLSHGHAAVIISAGWHILGAGLLGVVALITLPEPRALSAGKVQVLLMVCGYLALSLYVVAAAKISKGALIAHLVAAAALGFGGAYLLLRFADLPVSPWLFAIGGIVSAIWALLPYLSARERLVAVIFLSAAVVALLTVSRWSGSAFHPNDRHTVDTALHGVRVETFTGLVPRPASDGGALEADRLGTILVTGDGKFYWITERDHALVADPLNISDPMNRESYLKDFPDPRKAPRLRTTDIVFDQSPGRTRLFVAHQGWNRNQRCYTLRISETPLTWTKDGRPQSSGPWRQVFESSPCIKSGPPFDDTETGGRLAWTPDNHLLLTLGSLGFAGLDGTKPFSQRNDVDYGKILDVDPQTGRHNIVSTGHRNPQGLLVNSEGLIWEAEHGPEGGDEINLIERGANYGWPYATYGVDYGSNTWPLNPNGRDHGTYHEPAIAFVPSMAIAPLIQVRGPEFPHWNGDLLAGSLRTEALFRVRLRDNRPIYYESFSLGHRIRDLVQTGAGRIIIWSDDGTLMELRRDDQQDAYTRFCASCHAPQVGKPIAPPLTGVVGRPIASVPGFPYSAGLKGRSGAWNEETLDAFLQNPNAFAPGTTMRLYGLDAKSRAEVIKELKTKGRRQ